MPLYPPSKPPNTIPTSSTVQGEEALNVLPLYLNHYIYIWVNTRGGKPTEVWMYPTTLTDTVLSGYTWRGKYWNHLDLPKTRIISFF